MGRISRILIGTLVGLALGSAQIDQTLRADGARPSEKVRAACTLFVNSLFTPKAEGPIPAVVPIDIEGFLNFKLPRPLLRLANFVPPALHAQYFYQLLNTRNSDPQANLFSVGQDVLDLQIEVTEADLQRLPQAQYLMISNHPTGAIDGIVLANILRRVRQEKFRIFVAAFLKATMEADPRFKDHFAYLDRTESETARGTNLRAFRDFHRDSRAGYVHILFPGGSIAQKGDGVLQTKERPWAESTAGLAQKAGTVVPVYIHARNPELYYLFDKIHPSLRRALYFWVMLKNQGQKIRVTIGDPLSAEQIEKLGANSAERTEGLRQIVLELGRR